MECDTNSDSDEPPDEEPRDYYILRVPVLLYELGKKNYEPIKEWFSSKRIRLELEALELCEELRLGLHPSVALDYYNGRKISYSEEELVNLIKERGVGLRGTGPLKSDHELLIDKNTNNDFDEPPDDKPEEHYVLRVPILSYRLGGRDHESIEEWFSSRRIKSRIKALGFCEELKLGLHPKVALDHYNGKRISYSGEELTDLIRDSGLDLEEPGTTPPPTPKKPY